MANRDGNTATSTEVIPAGHAELTAEEELAEDWSDTSTGLAGLSVAALGVVFGDIGTSPVYTFRECFNPEHGFPLDAEHVLGVLSMIFWALIIVVAVKYVLLIMRADNQGEGGILALLALAQETAPRHTQRGGQEPFRVDAWRLDAGARQTRDRVVEAGSNRRHREHHVSTRSSRSACSAALRPSISSSRSPSRTAGRRWSVSPMR